MLMSTDLLAEPADISTKMVCFEEYLPSRSILCKQEHVNTQNSAKLMDQERAEFPKTRVGWMVLQQSFLVLPQECILVLH